jgi:membrane protein DedA with SNARE-associated domain
MNAITLTVLSYLIWVLGWPLVAWLTSDVHILKDDSGASLLAWVVWIVVGAILAEFVRRSFAAETAQNQSRKKK